MKVISSEQNRKPDRFDKVVDVRVAITGVKCACPGNRKQAIDMRDLESSMLTKQRNRGFSLIRRIIRAFKIRYRLLKKRE